jgi:hypothetical protein
MTVTANVALLLISNVAHGSSAIMDDGLQIFRMEFLPIAGSIKRLHRFSCDTGQIIVSKLVFLSTSLFVVPKYVSRISVEIAHLSPVVYYQKETIHVYGGTTWGLRSPATGTPPLYPYGGTSFSNT